jgi:hypothetical protein
MHLTIRNGTSAPELPIEHLPVSRADGLGRNGVKRATGRHDA